MKKNVTILSLILEAPEVHLPNDLIDEMLFSHFRLTAIELLKKDSAVINHFGFVPDNGAEGIDDLMIDGTLFRFDAPQDILGVNLDDDLINVKLAYLYFLENKIPVHCAVSEERGEHKNEKTIVFDFSGL